MPRGRPRKTETPESEPRVAVTINGPVATQFKEALARFNESDNFPFQLTPPQFVTLLLQEFNKYNQNMRKAGGTDKSS